MEHQLLLLEQSSIHLCFLANRSLPGVSALIAIDTILIRILHSEVHLIMLASNLVEALGGQGMVGRLGGEAGCLMPQACHPTSATYLSHSSSACFASHCLPSDQR